MMPFVFLLSNEPDNTLHVVLEVIPHIQSAESIPKRVIHAADPSAANGNNLEKAKCLASLLQD